MLTLIGLTAALVGFTALMVLAGFRDPCRVVAEVVDVGPRPTVLVLEVKSPPRKPVIRGQTVPLLDERCPRVSTGQRLELRCGRYVERARWGEWWCACD